jgi:hypothetical protein
MILEENEKKRRAILKTKYMQEQAFAVLNSLPSTEPAFYRGEIVLNRAPYKYITKFQLVLCTNFMCRHSFLYYPKVSTITNIISNVCNICR